MPKYSYTVVTSNKTTPTNKPIIALFGLETFVAFPLSAPFHYPHFPVPQKRAKYSRHFYGQSPVQQLPPHPRSDGWSVDNDFIFKSCLLLSGEQLSIYNCFELSLIHIQCIIRNNKLRFSIFLKSDCIQKNCTYEFFF